MITISIVNIPFNIPSKEAFPETPIHLRTLVFPCMENSSSYFSIKANASEGFFSSI